MPLSMNLSRYLPEDAEVRLKEYEYSGEDRSYIYKYFWRPLCRSLVTKIPMWVAPNVITVTALVLVIFAHIFLWWWMPNITIDPERPNPPSWIFYYAAVSLVLYQLLDNLDGHQARRTGTSSPLGLLMDHGCDALNTCVGSLSAATALCLGPTWKSWSALMVAVVVFFANTLEEYYRGSLILPVINGANEGIFLVVGCYLYTGYMGPSVWLTEFRVPAELIPNFVSRAFQDIHLLKISDGYDLATGDIVFQLNTVMLCMMVASGIFTTFGNVYQIYIATTKNVTREHGAKFGVSWLCRNYPFVHALTRAIPLVGISILANVWFYFSPVDVYRAHPRLFCWTAGLLFTKLSIHLMIAHLCSVEFHPFRRTLVPFFAIGAHWFCSAAIGASKFRIDGHQLLLGDEELLLIEFFLLSATTFLHLAFNAVLEARDALKVPVFTMPRKAVKKSQ